MGRIYRLIVRSRLSYTFFSHSFHSNLVIKAPVCHVFVAVRLWLGGSSKVAAQWAASRASGLLLPSFRTCTIRALHRRLSVGNLLHFYEELSLARFITSLFRMQLLVLHCRLSLGRRQFKRRRRGTWRIGDQSKWTFITFTFLTGRFVCCMIGKVWERCCNSINS